MNSISSSTTPVFNHFLKEHNIPRVFYGDKVRRMKLFFIRTGKFF